MRQRRFTARQVADILAQLADGAMLLSDLEDYCEQMGYRLPRGAVSMAGC